MRRKWVSELATTTLIFGGNECNGENVGMMIIDEAFSLLDHHLHLRARRSDPTYRNRCIQGVGSGLATRFCAMGPGL